MFLECRLVSTSLCGVLSVYERVIFLTILIRVCECYLDVLTLHVYDRVETVVCHCVVQKIRQTVTAQYPVAVVHYGQAGVKVGIVSQHCFHIIVVERIVEKQRVVRFEEDVCSVFVVGVFGHVVNEVTSLEGQLSDFSVTV